MPLLRSKNISVLILVALTYSCTLLNDFTECAEDNDCREGLFFCAPEKMCLSIKDESNLPAECPYLLGDLDQPNTKQIGLLLPFSNPQLRHLIDGVIIGVIGGLTLLSDSTEGSNPYVVIGCDDHPDQVATSIKHLNRLDVKAIIGGLTSEERDNIEVHARDLKIPIFSPSGLSPSLSSPLHPHWYRMGADIESTVDVESMVIIELLRRMEDSFGASSIITIWDRSQEEQALRVDRFQEELTLARGEDDLSSHPVYGLSYEKNSTSRLMEIPSLISETTFETPVRMIYFLDTSNIKDLEVYLTALADREDMNDPPARHPMLIVTPDGLFPPSELSKLATLPFDLMSWSIYQPHFLGLPTFESLNTPEEELILSDFEISTETIFSSLESLLTPLNFDLLFTPSVGLSFDAFLLIVLVLEYSSELDFSFKQTLDELTEFSETPRSFNDLDWHIPFDQLGLTQRPVSLLTDQSWGLLGITGFIEFEENAHRLSALPLISCASPMYKDIETAIPAEDRESLTFSEELWEFCTDATSLSPFDP
jgi:hypothetical protein